MVLPATYITTYGSLLTFYLLVALPLYAAGLFAFFRAPQHPIARRLLILGAVFSMADFFEGLLGRLYVSRGVFTAMWLVNLAYQATTVLMLIFTARLFALFPEGRYRARYERVALRVLWVYLLVPLLLLLARPTLLLPDEVFSSLRPPIAPPHVRSPIAVSWLSVLRGPAAGLFLGATILLSLTALVILALRYRGSTYEQRIQIKWVLYAVTLMAAIQIVAQAVIASGLISDRAGVVLQNVTIAPVAVVLLVAFLIALFRHRLLDIDLVIRRSIVYGAVWLIIGAVYVGVAAGVGIAAGHRVPVGVAIVVTVAATLLFQPLHQRLERVAGRLIYGGERLSRYQLLTRFGETLEHAFDVGQLAPQVAVAVRSGLDLKWARVSLSFQEGVPAHPAGASGIGLDEDEAPDVTVPLEHAGEPLGTIECGPRAEGRLKPEDQELLATIARQAALGIHNSRLASELSARLDEIRRQAGELAASRARIVQTQETERRRIERNIHDGVQQEMVALVAKVRLARNQLRRDPEVADTTLEELQHEARQTLEELRELSRGIHPAVLTDRGLLEAVEERTSRLPLGVAVHAPAALRGVRFGEETEGAAYFFVSEALANVLKHAAASRATVRLRHEDDRLFVEVADDGVGFVPADATGSGLTGLRDRIEAVGGSLRVASRVGEGTTVAATLPAVIREGAERVG